MGVVCKVCKKIFTRQSNLNAHLKNIHKEIFNNIISYDFNVFNNKCLEGCNVSFRNVNDLRKHLEHLHNFNVEAEILNFPSLMGMY